MKISVSNHKSFVRRLGFTLALACLTLCLGVENATAGRVIPPLPKKPMIVEYKAACGMIYSPADAKKYRYVCPIDHSKLVPFAVAPTKAKRGSPTSVPFVQATPAAQVQALFFTPGGAYSLADIKVNGRQTPTVKYQNIMPQHDLNLVKGDYVCPITKTKANPKFSWVVGGQTYYFCCPPCIEEFVKQAKEHPESIRPPQAYVQK
jgi:YHS domain-containing protein